MKGKNSKRVFVHDPRKLFTPHINKDTTTTRYSLPNEKPSFFRGNQRPYHIISLMVPIFVPNYKKALCCLRGNVLLKVSQAPPLQRVAVSILLSLGHISAQREKNQRNMKGKTQRNKSNLSTGGRRGLHPAEALMLFWTRIHTDRRTCVIHPDSSSCGDLPAFLPFVSIGYVSFKNRKINN